jgi:hypothetical protein
MSFKKVWLTRLATIVTVEVPRYVGSVVVKVSADVVASTYEYTRIPFVIASPVITYYLGPQSSVPAIVIVSVKPSKFKTVLAASPPISYVIVGIVCKFITVSRQ